MRQQQIETLEAYLAETKEALNKIQTSSSAQLEQQIDKFNEERKELIAKIERLTADLTRKERQVTTLENQKESVMQQLTQKEKQLQQARDEGAVDKQEMNEKIEGLRGKHSETLDELTQKKIEFERDKALKSQQLQFQE
jgi:chromosome segregation ATPase